MINYVHVTSFEYVFKLLEKDFIIPCGLREKDFCDPYNFEFELLS